VLCLNGRANVSRDGMMNILKQKGIGSQVHYIPVYRHPYYRRLGWLQKNCRQAEVYFKNCLSIPIHPAMSDEEMDRVTGALEDIGRMY
jgi:dTDP-4-amino-4,6-dideoxygalactose transaminase